MNIVLVYQTGLASLFEVERHGLTAAERGTVTLLYRSTDFDKAAAIARGAALAKADVRTAACSLSGDIRDLDWTCDVHSVAPLGKVINGEIERAHMVNARNLRPEARFPTRRHHA